MGQEKKKQLNKLLEFVKELYDDPGNKEFVAGIQSMVLQDIKNEHKEEWTRQISEIYELCLKKNLQEQAEDLYKDFPLQEIAPELADLYVQMEDARRRNDFDSFGLRLYQQIELIVNKILEDPEVVDLYDRIRDLPPVLKYDTIQRRMIRVVDSRHSTVEEYLLLKSSNVGKPLKDLWALERIRIVIYAVGFLAEVEKYPRDKAFKEQVDTISAIYNVRNHDAHSGATPSEKQEEYYEAIIADPTQNYLRFLAFLLSFIKEISANYPLSDEIKSI